MSIAPIAPVESAFPSGPSLALTITLDATIDYAF